MVLQVSPTGSKNLLCSSTYSPNWYHILGMTTLFLQVTSASIHSEHHCHTVYTTGIPEQSHICLVHTCTGVITDAKAVLKQFTNMKCKIIVHIRKSKCWQNGNSLQTRQNLDGHSSAQMQHRATVFLLCNCICSDVCSFLIISCIYICTTINPMTRNCSLYS